LERGWDAVVKALAAQGLPTGILPAETTQSPSLSANSTPVSPVAPFSLLDAPPAFTFDFNFSPPSPTSPSTRHLARVATSRSSSLMNLLSLQRVDRKCRRHPRKTRTRQWKASSGKSSSTQLRRIMWILKHLQQPPQHRQHP